jgi:hypothetical protein
LVGRWSTGDIYVSKYPEARKEKREALYLPDQCLMMTVQFLNLGEIRMPAPKETPMKVWYAQMAKHIRMRGCVPQHRSQARWQAILGERKANSPVMQFQCPEQEQC